LREIWHPPKNWEESQSRPDAVLFRLAFARETEAFQRLKVMSFGHTKAELAVEGITNKPIPLKVIPSIKKLPDGKYERHKIRIL
jgi:hypothetical protein